MNIPKDSHQCIQIMNDKIEKGWGVMVLLCLFFSCDLVADGNPPYDSRVSQKMGFADLEKITAKYFEINKIGTQDYYISEVAFDPVGRIWRIHYELAKNPVYGGHFVLYISDEDGSVELMKGL